MESYKVKPGDNLTKIGRRFGVSLAEMLKANKTLRDPNLILPGQMVNVPTVGRHVPSDSPAAGTTAGDFYGGSLPTSGSPAADPAYIQNAIVAVGLPIWGGPFYLYRKVVNGRGTDAVVLNRKDAAFASDPLRDSYLDLQLLFGSRQEAEAAAAKASKAYGISGPFAYYKTGEGLIYPTVISDTTAPALCKALREAVAGEQADAKAASKLATELLLWYVGARLPLKTGEGGQAAKTTANAAEAALAGFNAAEKGIIIEVRGMLKAAEMAQIRQAYAAGKDVTVKIGGRLIQYEPGLKASGMTMFGENGFLIGREAFTSEAELIKTLLHETYRLTTSAIGKGAAANASSVKLETEAAFTFAERAYQAVIAGL